MKKKKEDNIINNFKSKGVYKFFGEDKINVHDNLVIEKKEKYNICIFKYFLKETENNDFEKDDKENEIIFRERAKTFRKSICDFKKEKDETVIFFGTTKYNVKKKSKITTIKVKLKNLLSYIPGLSKKQEKKEKEKNKGEIKDNREINNPLLSDLKPNKNNDNNFKGFFTEPSQKRTYKPGIIGLQNIGATCYMNATLQCFSNIKRFRDNLLYIHQYLENNKNEKKLSFALVEVFKNLWIILDHSDYPPYNFKKVIGEMNPLFKGIAANDPKDLVLFLLETTHKELNNPKKKILDNNNAINTNNFNDVFKEFIKYFTNNNNSLVCEEFYGCTNSMTTCAICKTTNHNVQVLNILFFPLEEVRKFIYSENSVKIEDCFLHYEKQEIYPSYYCNNCRQLFPAYNQTKLIYAPPSLIINLNRGKGLQFNVSIEFEEYLDLRNYVYAQDSPNYYELVGVICHLGSNDMGGHFIAYCKNSENTQWYKYNDGIVNNASFNEIKKAKLPYVLFYSYIKI